VTGSTAAVVTNTPPAGMGYAGTPASYWSTSGSSCFSDSGGDSGDRVQVAARRGGKIEALVFSRTVTLTARASAKFEG
jgi:hypothetical protein